jgi:hypothetical protein
MRKAHEVVPRPDMTQYLYFFENGYGASVIQFKDGHEGLWELGVREKGKRGMWCLTDKSPIGDVVFGGQTEAEIDALLDRLEALPKRFGAKSSVQKEVVK